MDIELTPDESDAVQAALRRYVSDLRVEISNTDNPEYKRQLRQEREALEGALAKLDTHTPGGEQATTGDAAAVAVVRLWWTATSR